MLKQEATGGKVISYPRRKCVGKDIWFQKEHNLWFRKIKEGIYEIHS